MKCSKCGKEMKAGYVRAVAKGGICWVDNKNEWKAAREDPGFLAIGSLPWIKSSCIPAYHCAECKNILIDYSEDK